MRRVDLLRGLDGTGQHAVAGAEELQAGVERQQLLHRGEARVHRRAAAERGEPERAGVRVVQAAGRRAGQEQRVAAVQVDVRRQRAGVERHHVVHETPAPARAAAVRIRALPLLRLVGMRIEVPRHRRVVQLRAGERLEQRADVEDRRGVRLVVEPLDVDERRVQAVAAAPRRQQGALRQRDRTAHRRVRPVTRVDRHDHVVGIVAAEEEQADERLVAGARLRERRDRRQVRHVRRHGGRAQSAAAPQEFASILAVHRLLLVSSVDSRA